LITGACGFIGSHLAEMCVQSGFEVKAFDRYNPNNDWGWLEQSEYKKELEIVLGDIRDYDSVYDAMDGCKIVFHLAALIGIPYSYVSPLAYIRTNIEGTYNVLEAAKKRESDSVLITSTSETYGTAQYVPIDEEHPLEAQSPYSATKISADQLAMSYFRSFGLPVKIVRPFNTYGPRQSTRAIIPTVISQLMKGKKEVFLGNIGTTRDLTFVKDTAKGFIEIYNTDELIGETTNIGTNEEIAIGDLARLIAELMGVDLEIRCDAKRVRPDSSEVERLRCDNTKIKKNTNWKPQYDLKKGLSETIDWMSRNLERFKPEIYHV